MRRYKCEECGYIHIGNEVPDVCPVCGYDSTVFFLMDDGEENSENEYFDMVDDPNPDLLKKMRKQLDSISQLVGVTWAMYNQALKENDKELAEEFKTVSNNLRRQASTYAMFLGEFLEFNSESNMDELKIQLEKLNSKNEDVIKLLIEDGNEDQAEILKNIIK